MPKRRVAAIALAVLLTGAPAAVRAAEIGPAQAQDLAKQLHAFASATLGPDVKLPDDLIRVAPEGDHFALSLPIAGLGIADASGAGPAALTATARQRNDGTWAINDIRFPQTSRFSFDLPGDAGRRARRGAGATPEREATKGKTLHLTGTLTVAGQDSNAVYDPSFATPSTLSTSFHGLEMRATGPGIEQAIRIDRNAGLVTLRPAGDGHVDVLEDVTAEGYSVTESRTGGDAFAFGAKKLSVKAEIDRLALHQLPDAIQATISLGGPAMQAVGKHDTPRLPDLNRAALHRLVGALTGIVSGMRVTETLEGVRAVFDGHEITADRLTLGTDGAAPETMLTAHLDVALDGLNVAGLPPDIAAYVPRHIELRPVLSGVDARALTEIALSATEPGSDPKRVEGKLIGLLQHGGIDVGLETFALDVGPARLTGVGSMNVSGPGDATGTAKLVATGFDQLMDQVKDAPQAGTALPVLALLRGFAKTDGDRLVWNVTMDRHRTVLVNGIDISMLTGGNKP